jgi:hypothetical protein
MTSGFKVLHYRKYQCKLLKRAYFNLNEDNSVLKKVLELLAVDSHDLESKLLKIFGV